MAQELKLSSKPRRIKNVIQPSPTGRLLSSGGRNMGKVALMRKADGLYIAPKWFSGYNHSIET